MRLAILTAYHFTKELQPLVALHLEQIRRHTDVDFTIYGGAVRLHRAERDWLATQLDVTLPPMPALTLAPRAQHNDTLDAMARYAYADGATHFVSLHLDSFPIDAGWLDSAAAAVADGVPFSCIQPKCYNAFMFWDRAWQETGVGMLPTAADRAGTAFARFIIEHPTLNHADGGLGFLFNAWQAGRQWHSVEQTSPTIWGNRLMHLEGATRIAMSKQLPSILTRVKTPISLLLPDKLRKYLSLLVWRFFAKPVEQPAGGPTLSSKQEQISAVVADPEGFIARCRATQLSTDYGVSAVE